MQIPVTLQNGKQLPKSFAQVHDDLGVPLRYKVIVSGADRLFNRYRLIHCYYVGLLDNDPSHFQTLLNSKAKRLEAVFESGKLLKDVIGYSQDLYTSQMFGFSGMLGKLIAAHSKIYAMVTFHNLVQYCNDPNGEQIVFSRLDFS